MEKKGTESIEELKSNYGVLSITKWKVLKEDYITRVYSLPPKFGVFGKMHCSRRTIKPTIISGVSSNIFVDERFGC